MEQHGRITLPTEVGAEEATRELIVRLGADAIRNSDGTELPKELGDAVEKVYATRFVARGDNEWAHANPAHVVRQYLLSHRVTAEGETLTIDPLATYYREQFAPDLAHDPHRWWEVIDRTTGEVVPTADWEYDEAGVVTIKNATAWHEYTVTVLAEQIWDTTQMYNYITNDWQGVEKHRPFDVRYPETWEHVCSALRNWLAENPDVSVVRFTTFFYHFTIAFGSDAKEKFVDWFGYSASVSPLALTQFAEKYGYDLRPEDFVDQGYYNSPFRVPSQRFRDWMEFQNEFVTEKVRALVEIVHEAGREAMMFLGDNWIGTEPYGERFAHTGLDAVVGSVGSAATTRMIAEIPGVKYTEGRMLPYFFPDVFRPGGDPLSEAQQCWTQSRRAIFRKPLDRIGYGGYVSLALQFPEFIDYTEHVANEFREIHARSHSHAAEPLPLKVGVLNHWGKLRSWMCEMVAHALWYKQIYTYLGVLESLAGLPIEVEFLSFAEIAEGVPAGIDVLISSGDYGTAWSGGEIWTDPQLQSVIRSWVNAGGGLVGIGNPTAWLANGRTFQLSDVFGVEREMGFSLSTDKYVTVNPEHYVAADLGEGIDTGEGARNVYPISPEVQVVRYEGEVQLAVNTYGRGRAVYFAGLPYSPENARALLRALLWAGNKERENLWWSSNPHVDIAVYPETNSVALANLSLEEQEALITRPDGSTFSVKLEPAALTWREVD